MAKDEEVGTGKPELDRYIAQVENYGIDKQSEKPMTATEARSRQYGLGGMNQEVVTMNFRRAYMEMAYLIYHDNVNKGFWDKPRNVGEMLMLAVTELSEGMEAWRKDQKDQHLPIYDGLAVEIADCIIRLMDMSEGLGLPVADALIDKLAFNRTRPYKHGKKC